MSEIALLTFGETGEQFYADKDLAAKFVVAYDDASMEIRDFSELQKKAGQNTEG